MFSWLSLFIRIFIFILQVDLDEKAAAKITDNHGDISKEDFVKLAQDNKLLDFGNAMGGDSVKQGAVKKQQRTYIHNNNNTGQQSRAQAAVGTQGGKVS